MPRGSHLLSHRAPDAIGSSGRRNELPATHAALDFVENEQHVAFVANPAQSFQKLASKMIVATFTLNRFDNDGRDVSSFFLQNRANLVLSLALLLSGFASPILQRQREVQCGCADARPWKLRKVVDLACIRVRQAHRIAAATVKRFL